MKDCIWKLIIFCTSVSIAIAIDRSMWTPTCPLTSSENAFISHPADCRKFFVCIDAIAYPISCSFGLNWNPMLKKCSSQSSCENKKNIRIPRYNPLCASDAKLTRLPDNYDCGKFYECQGGLAFHMTCPLGMHWSVEHENCEDASVANCKVTRGVVGNGQWNPACPFNDDPENPTHLPHLEDCTKFLKCSFGRSFIVSCPWGLHWDVDGKRCESPSIAQCENKQKATSLPPTTSPSATIRPTTLKPGSTAKPSPNIPKCPQNGVENFGIPGQCNKYFSCSQGKLYVMYCREGREWSQIVRGCVDASLAKCTGLSSKLGKTSTIKNRPAITNGPSNKPYFTPLTTQPSILSTKSTSCRPGVGFLSHPTDCHKFFLCDNGKPVEMLCPTGLYFSRKTLSCEWTSIDC